MGLDIAFNKEAAFKAGLVVTTQRIGSDAEIEVAREEGDIDYLRYLKQDEHIFQVPETDHCVATQITETSLLVRANKWGSTYAPLTAWLTKHNIPWAEY